MGSDSDLPIVEKAITTLQEFNVPTEVHVFSAHRTPEEARAFSVSARAEGFGAIIAAAGKAAHLAGAIAANTTLPVIGIPIKSSLDGIDALLSTVQMPSGIPVATVAIDGAANAALLSIQILALSDETLAQKLEEARREGLEKVLGKNAAIEDRYEIKVAKNGKPFFNLKASNGQVIGASQMYASERTMKLGIASVAKNAPEAPVVEEI